MLTASVQAADEEFTDYPLLTADGIAHAMTLSTLPESPSAFVFNPAAQPGGFLPQLAHNHSLRHFPAEGGKLEMDQLDNDFESVIMHLVWSSFAHGFTLADEHGYDFTNHPPARFPFPREEVKGSEVCTAYSLGTYPVKVGLSLRRFRREYYPPASLAAAVPRQAKPRFAGSLVTGEGQSYGLLLGLPWLRYARSCSRLDLRKLQLPVGMESLARQKERRSGWRVMPLGWMSAATETSLRSQSPFTEASTRTEAPRSCVRSWSVALRPLSFLEVSVGSVDGRRAWGCKLVMPGVVVKYAEIKDFLRRITGVTSSFFGDLHFGGIDLALL